MTDEKPAAGEPLSVDELADLHAGVLDDRTAARLWPRVLDDPQAQAVLAALDATSADLGALGSESAAPMPAGVAGRIDAALSHEAGRGQEGAAPVVGIDTARRKRNRLLAWGTGIVTTVAAAVTAVAVISPGGQVEQLPKMAQPVPSAGAGTGTEPAQGHALALHSGNLSKAVGPAVGVRRLGPLQSEARLAACLAANGIDPDVTPAGVRPATIDGRRAVIVLYPTGEFAQYRLVALPADCGSNNVGLLADTVIGRGSN